MRLMNTDQTASASVRVLFAYTGDYATAPSTLMAILGCARSKASELINGRRGWRNRDLDQVAAYFGVRAADLYEGPKLALDAYDQAHPHTVEQHVVAGHRAFSAHSSAGLPTPVA